MNQSLNHCIISFKIADIFSDHCWLWTIDSLWFLGTNKDNGTFCLWIDWQSYYSLTIICVPFLYKQRNSMSKVNLHLKLLNAKWRKVKKSLYNYLGQLKLSFIVWTLQKMFPSFPTLFTFLEFCHLIHFIQRNTNS